MNTQFAAQCNGLSTCKRSQTMRWTATAVSDAPRLRNIQLPGAGRMLRTAGAGRMPVRRPPSPPIWSLRRLPVNWSSRMLPMKKTRRLLPRAGRMLPMDRRLLPRARRRLPAAMALTSFRAVRASVRDCGAFVSIPLRDCGAFSTSL